MLDIRQIVQVPLKPQVSTSTVVFVWHFAHCFTNVTVLLRNNMNGCRENSYTDGGEENGWHLEGDLIKPTPTLHISSSLPSLLNPSLPEDKMGFRRESVHQFSMPAHGTQSWVDQLMALLTNSFQVNQTRAGQAIWSIVSIGAMAGVCATKQV